MYKDAEQEPPTGDQVTPISTRELAQAKEAVNALLEELKLPAYLFEVEPRTGPWEVHIDCAAGDVWQSLTLPVDVTELVETLSNPAARSRLVTKWRAQLDACVKTPG